MNHRSGARRLRHMLAAAGCALLVTGCVSIESHKAAAPRVAANEPVKAVYHFTLGVEEAQRGLGNIRNHLNAHPTVKIIAVGNGNGIEFMLEGAKDRNGNPFDATIQDLKSKGVEFRLCNNTLVTRKIDKTKVIAEVDIVPSGVAEAARLQAREGFVYLRP
jgi:intracellular sulfur oxidation DsrE/DsrF family protein